MKRAEENELRRQQGLPPIEAYQSVLDVTDAQKRLPTTGRAALRLTRPHGEDRAGAVLEFEMSSMRERLAAGELLDSGRAEVI